MRFYAAILRVANASRPDEFRRQPTWPCGEKSALSDEN